MKAGMAKLAIQEVLGIPKEKQFQNIGPLTRSLFEKLARTSNDSDWPNQEQWIEGPASSFADPADIRRFNSCKSAGGTDGQCFKVGDNGIGVWGDLTTGNVPMCALPREDWEKLDKPRGKLVEVRANGRTVFAELRDTMPRKANIRNGAVIDLNPAAAKALNLKPPFLVPASWRWA